MKEFNFEEYNDSIHNLGRIFLTITFTMIIGAPFLIAKILGAQIDWPAFFKAITAVLIVYIPSCIVEYLIYVPLLGSGASYLAFITGNITNLKLPCAFASRDMAKIEVGTDENEIISTLSVATSSLVTMLVIFVGVLCLIPLTPVLNNPIIKPAFDNVLPALFGALAYQYFKKSLLITLPPLSFMVLLCVIVPAMINSTSFLLIACGGIAIGLAWILFKKKILK